MAAKQATKIITVNVVGQLAFERRPFSAELQPSQPRPTATPGPLNDTPAEAPRGKWRQTHFIGLHTGELQFDINLSFRSSKHPTVNF